MKKVRLSIEAIFKKRFIEHVLSKAPSTVVRVASGYALAIDIFSHYPC